MKQLEATKLLNANQNGERVKTLNLLRRVIASERKTVKRLEITML
jgi:hypothetical protein